MKQIPYHLIAVTGPTASGKTAFAAHLASRINGEIISADSRQVYRHMNIGTGKDYEDYVVGNTRIPVHLIDMAEPGYKYSVYEYRHDFTKAYHDITARGRFPVICGGSGMYLTAVTGNYRLDKVPENADLRKELAGKTLGELTTLLQTMKKLHNTTDTDTIEHALRAIEIETWYRHNPVTDPPAMNYNTLFIGILYNRETERKRITERLEYRLQNGMTDEVRSLLEKGISPESLIYYGLEYRYITLYLTGKLSYEAMKTQLNIAIHQFSKRQRTWFRKMEKEGFRIHWIEGERPMEEKLQQAISLAGF